MGESGRNDKYVLVVKDVLSGHVWMEPSIYSDALHAASILSRWTRVFTAPNVSVSDLGSNFKNEILQNLAQLHRIRHTLTVAYSPWVHGTVEAVMRSILAATREMLGELKFAPQDWASVLSTVASTLNESSLERFGRRPDGVARSPFEFMTGIQPKRQILRILPTISNKGKATTMEHARTA